MSDPIRCSTCARECSEFDFAAGTVTCTPCMWTELRAARSTIATLTARAEKLKSERDEAREHVKKRDRENGDIMDGIVLALRDAGVPHSEPVGDGGRRMFACADRITILAARARNAEASRDGWHTKACEDASEIARLRAALRDLEARHVESNRRAGRPESHSRTLRVIRAALSPALGEACSVHDVDPERSRCRRCGKDCSIAAVLGRLDAAFATPTPPEEARGEEVES